MVRNCNHYGAAAYYASMALPYDMIGISMTNTLASMAPTGGTQAVVGNNPFAIAFPSSQEPPIILDMATSKSSWGALMVAAQRGSELPEDCFLGPDGLPTVDPQAVMSGGFMLPSPGTRATGWRYASRCSQASWTLLDRTCAPVQGPDAPGDNSYLMMAISVGCFGGRRFKHRRQVVRRVRQVHPAASRGCGYRGEGVQTGATGWLGSWRRGPLTSARARPRLGQATVLSINLQHTRRRRCRRATFGRKLLMPLPIVAIVGRPNVGKSTLFNRLVGRRVAVVEDFPGVTRDRLYARGELLNRQVVFVDTGGMVGAEGDPLFSEVNDQAVEALRERTCWLLLWTAARRHSP